MAYDSKPLANHDLVESVILNHTRRSFEASATRITDHLIGSGFLARGGMAPRQIDHNVFRLLRDMDIPYDHKMAFCGALCARLWGKRGLYLLEHKPQPVFQ